MNKKELLLKLGFTVNENLKIMDCIEYDLKRDRKISVVDIDTPNEFVYIQHIDSDENNLIVLSNYDYDGLMTYKDICYVLYDITKDPKFLV